MAIVASRKKAKNQFFVVNLCSKAYTILWQGSPARYVRLRIKVILQREKGHRDLAVPWLLLTNNKKQWKRSQKEKTACQHDTPKKHIWYFLWYSSGLLKAITQELEPCTLLLHFSNQPRRTAMKQNFLALLQLYQVLVLLLSTPFQSN